jgi:hypothetical protein
MLGMLFPAGQAAFAAAFRKKEAWVRLSLSELRAQLRDAEDRLVIARRSPRTNPIVLAALEAEAADLRETVFARQRERAASFMKTEAA